ncbi:putative DNA-binding transcriptional regulator [Serratia rubidaea]|uniref:Putative DNA-binding transcriptional regulator n=1 Tax=Serratia rubidaea TaxID=61652 RepID=A0A4V6JH25_SERRU|nr:putative DNA-binding transcriptional regulator [Serratia rubidaea]
MRRMAPAHRVLPLVARGELAVLQLQEPFPPSACCLTWQQPNQSPAIAWLLDYLGDSETLNQEWLSEEQGRRRRKRAGLPCLAAGNR